MTTILLSIMNTVPQGSEALGAMTAGGRVKGWVNDYIGVGANYQTEEKDNPRL